MTFDERLERIAESRKALTPSVEMLMRAGRAGDAKIRALGRVVEVVGKFTKEIAVGIARLLPIVKFHENRIPRLEVKL